MSGTRDDSILLDDIVDFAGRLVELGRVLSPSVDPSIECREGILYNLIMLGEAAKRLQPSTRNRFAEIPWTALARTRDRVVHHYEGIDWPKVRDVVQEDAATLLPRLVEIRDILRAEFDATRG